MTDLEELEDNEFFSNSLIFGSRNQLSDDILSDSTNPNSTIKDDSQSNNNSKNKLCPPIINTKIVNLENDSDIIIDSSDDSNLTQEIP